jgi:hypothetical protein
MQGQTEKAWQVISDLHNDPQDPDQEYARGEFYQMKKQAELDRTLDPSWTEMWTKKSYRKRVVSMYKPCPGISHNTRSRKFPELSFSGLEKSLKSLY